MTKSLQLGLWGDHRGRTFTLEKLEQEKAVRKRREKNGSILSEGRCDVWNDFFFFLQNL